jgi:hypothetical protein
MASLVLLVLLLVVVLLVLVLLLVLLLGWALDRRAAVPCTALTVP